MKKIILNIIIIFLFAGNLITLHGQEHLSGLQINPELQNLEPGRAFKSDRKSAKAVLDLPFIDDFAKTTTYPDPELWMDSLAFVNITYSVEPPSIGVATLDAINANGNIYSNASNDAFAADTLTSRIINLNYPGDNTIFLSFFYQPGGLGDTPEKNDSLLLEFYSENLKTWIKVWSASFSAKDSLLKEYYSFDDTSINIKGDTLTDLKTVFQQVIVPVQGENFLNDTFQFRFRNYASLSVETDYEGMTSNSDHWNLDFIRLDKNRSINDTIINDITINQPMHSLLNDYEAIPWHHYGVIYSDAMIDTISVFCKNLSDIQQSSISRYEITDTKGLYSPIVLTGNNDISLAPFQYASFSRLLLDYTFPYNINIDSIVFKIKGYLEPATVSDSVYNWNDTTTFYQKFFNYYAFDDGTAENGYGIVGLGTENAMVSMQFDSYIEDTLRGVQLYFNNLANNSQTKYFKIHVWDDNNGKPGNIIYTLENQVVPKNNQLNKFVLFLFDEEIIVRNKFYIGWQKQNSPDMLNVGYDVNRNNKDKLFYNFTNQWKQSEFDGTVMLRPMFGHEINTITGAKKIKRDLRYNVFPNPANDYLQIEIDQNNYSNYQYSIFDSFGRIHKTGYLNNAPINISNLDSGIYFIKVNSENGENSTKKIIVIH